MLFLMKDRLINLLFSTRLTAILFILYPTAMAFGTFIETWYSTDTAKIWIYNAWWFELIMVFMAINFTGNIFKPKMRDKALLYMNELVLYGHMCFNDYKTYPAQVLKDMGSNIKTIQKEIKLVMRKIEEQQVVKSKKKEIGTKFVFGLASGLPHLYHNVLWEELDTMKIQFEELEKLVIADKELKHKKTKTNFLGKIFLQ